MTAPGCSCDECVHCTPQTGMMMMMMENTTRGVEFLNSGSVHLPQKWIDITRYEMKMIWQELTSHSVWIRMQQCQTLLNGLNVSHTVSNHCPWAQDGAGVHFLWFPNLQNQKRQNRARVISCPTFFPTHLPSFTSWWFVSVTQYGKKNMIVWAWRILT